MNGLPGIHVTLFTNMFDGVDMVVSSLISNASVKVIYIISPLVSSCFAIYVMLVMVSYWRGHNSEPVTDFIWRVSSWSIILTFGMNIEYYSNYVVPLFMGIGDDVSRALMGSESIGSALDALTGKYIDGISTILSDANGLEGSLIAVLAVSAVILFGTPFISISAAHVVLARLSLGLLLAVGPIFLSAALFPATRRFCEAWIGQCLSYSILIVLVSSAGMIEINFAQSVVSEGMVLESVIKIALMGFAFVIISLHLPGLAAGLSGGVTLHSATAKISRASRMTRAIYSAAKRIGSRSSSGGSLDAF